MGGKRLERRLTAKQAAGATNPGSYPDGGGLTIEVDGAGRRYWIWRYRNGSRRREMGLGTVADLSLADARAERDRWRDVLKGGKDPVDERRRQARGAVAPVTFGEAADAYIAAHRPGWKNPKHAEQWVTTLGTHAARLRKRSVAEIATADVLAVLQPVWAKTPETASRLRSRIELVLDASRALGHIPEGAANPARWRGHLDKLLPRRAKRTKSHFAAMPWRDVPEFIHDLRCEESISARALEFLILTAARSGEVRMAAIAEFDFKSAIWAIPKERMKAQREHRVPLTPRMLEIVEEMRRTFPRAPFIFPGQDPQRPLSDMTLTVFMRKRGLKFTAHGFRSSFRDWAGDATSFPREIAEAALAHAVADRTEAAYRREDALERRREMMRHWQSFLDGEPGATVIQMRRGQ